ncbi:hypothetical protein [Thiolapillus sp.]|uniref:hypothetical protein n=1 Tax=Thiolapillus sp. TaxID=2017437 RepID=UPI003AF880E4
MLTTEDVQRQVAIAAVVAVEKTPFLLTVQRIIRRIQVEPDLARGLRYDSRKRSTSSRSSASLSAAIRL